VLSLLQLDDEQIRGDPDRVQQIVWNLLSNAVKFTPAQGSVRVLLDRVEDHARLRVTDNGKGIEADFLPHMFEWFRRDETSSQRRQDGLGLGLALVRHLVELHRGRIRAQSEGPGHGATFEVLLPLQLLPRAMAAPPPAQRSAAHPVPTLRGLHIMVIDYQAEARESLSVLLESMDASVHSFASGAQGLAWLEQHRTLHPVDVLLCDLAMPDEDGYETLRRLRAYETSKGIPKAQELKAIALTAYAQGEERRRALSAGFLLHVSKPASAYELAVAIHAVVEQTQRA
jgi:CheY-like chemotaxis protein